MGQGPGLCPSFGQLSKLVIVATNQRFLLCTRPPLDLTLDGNRVSNVEEMLRPYERDWQTLGGVTTVDALVVLRQSTLKPETGRPDVIAAVGTTQHVDVCTRLFQKSVVLPTLRDGRYAA